MEVAKKSQEVLRSSDQLTRRTERPGVKDFVITITVMGAIAAFAVGTAGLLGLRVNSMNTLNNLSLIGASILAIYTAGHFAIPTYEEVEEYLQHLGENEYIVHRGADKNSPATLMVSARHSSAEPELFDYSAFNKELNHDAYTQIYLPDLKRKAGKL